MSNPILIPLSLPNKRPVMATLDKATHTTILVNLGGETITFTRQGDRLGVGTPYKIAPQFLSGIPRPKGRPPIKPKVEPAPVGRPKEPPKERTRFDFRLPKSQVDGIDAIRGELTRHEWAKRVVVDRLGEVDHLRAKVIDKQTDAGNWRRQFDAARDALDACHFEKKALVAELAEAKAEIERLRQHFAELNPQKIRPPQ